MRAQGRAEKRDGGLDASFEDVKDMHVSQVSKNDLMVADDGSSGQDVIPRRAP